MKKISFALTPNSRNFVSLRGRQNMVRADLFSGSLAVWNVRGGVYLKKSELILRPIGSAGGIPLKPPSRPPRLEAEAERTISSFSNPPLADCSTLPSLAANSFIF